MSYARWEADCDGYAVNAVRKTAHYALPVNEGETVHYASQVAVY